MDQAAGEIVRQICERVQSRGGRALVVGGWVRDRLLGMPGDDYDIEVYGVQPDDLLALLGEHHELDLVGASFGRSFYILDDYSPLRLVNKEQLSEEATLSPSMSPCRAVTHGLPLRLPKAACLHIGPSW